MVPCWPDAVVEVNVRQLTEKHESGRDEPWSVDDAPEKYVAGQLRAIVGLDDAYAFLLPRVLFAADAPIRLDRRDVPPWLRGNVSARGLLASISVLRLMWSAVHR